MWPWFSPREWVRNRRIVKFLAEQNRVLVLARDAFGFPPPESRRDARDNYVNGELDRWFRRGRQHWWEDVAGYAFPGYRPAHLRG